MVEKMTCPVCGKRAGVHHHYQVKGVRYGGLPGRVRVYRCECGQEIRTHEVKTERLQEHQKHYHEKFQQYIKKNAALKEKILWLKRPVNSGQNRIQTIRAKLIDLLDSTF